MAAYVDVNGVNTWYDERGEGGPLVLLHGGMSDSRVFEGNLATLADRFRVLMPERRGHGHTADVEGPLTFDVLVQDTAAFCEEVVGAPAHLVGYSHGATVALLLALRRPDLVDRLVLVSGAFHRDGMLVTPSAEAGVPEPLARAYAEVSPDGPGHVEVVLAKIAQAAEREPDLAAEELGGIDRPTLVMAGDDDLVAHEHTLELVRGLPDAELAIVPGTSHLLLMEKPALCTMLVRQFLTVETVPTLMPIRRAQAGRGPGV